LGSKVAVTIDGPAGAGKSSVGRRLAQRLGWLFIDTGAMYRAVTLKAMRSGVDFADADALGRIARDADIRLTQTDAGTNVELDGEDVTAAIRTDDLTKQVRPVAACSSARAELVKKQRAISASQPAVMEGRDIGTVVLPDALVKVYLDASVEERARRRSEDLRRRGVADVDIERVKRDIESRDRSDMERADSPLKKASDADVVDTDGLTELQVVDRLEQLTRSRVTEAEGQVRTS
jgi:cytidylate kinase